MCRLHVLHLGRGNDVRQGLGCLKLWYRSDAKLEVDQFQGFAQESCSNAFVLTKYKFSRRSEAQILAGTFDWLLIGVNVGIVAAGMTRGHEQRGPQHVATQSTVVLESSSWSVKRPLAKPVLVDTCSQSVVAAHFGKGKALSRHHVPRRRTHVKRSSHEEIEKGEFDMR